MPAELSNFEKAMQANAAFGAVAYVPATIFTVKLYYNTVDLDGVGTECSAAGYAAKAINNNLTNFPSTLTGIKSLAVAHAFTTLSATSSPIVSAGIFDQLGNMRFREVFGASFIIESGQFYNLAVGDLTYTAS